MKRNRQPGRDRSNPNQSSSAMGSSKPRWKWNWTRLGYALTGVWALTGAIVTAIDLGTAQAMERQAQIGFFRLRGRVVPPNIVILAMDQESLARGDDYLLDPATNPQFEPIQSYPWKRSAYAIAIDKLMAAGARSVSIDVVFDGPRQDDPAGDEALRQALQQYGDRVVLAAQYEPFGTPESGEMGQMVFPSDGLEARRDRLGLINFAVDADQKVYQLPEFFIRQVLVPQGLGEGVSSFAAATLQAAGRSPTTLDGAIFFYGPPTTFPRVPFWHVLDPTNWAVHQQQGTFKDKIVLIGPTAELFQDFLSTPFSDKMPGIELHANAVGTLLENRDIHDAIPSLPLQGALVFVGIVATGGVILRFKRPVVQFLGALGIAIAWVGVSYLCLTYGSLIVPTAIPFIGITLTGLSTLVTGTINNQLEQRRLRSTLERYVAAPIVQEILTHYSDDFQSLLKGRRIKAAVLFCDIRSFTTISLHLEPEELVEQLNTYLNAMVEAILDAGGTIDKFIGDAIMAEFGSPISLGERADAMNAIRAALGMRRSLTVLQEQWQAEGKVVLFNGIGINFGEAIAGDIGSYRRREYALIGDAVNIASRVEGLTRKCGTDILITDSLYQLVKDEVEVVCVGAHELKGREDNKVLLYSLIGLKGDSPEPYHQLHEKLRALTDPQQVT